MSCLLCNGDSPFTGFWFPTSILIPPTLFHHYGSVAMVRTNKSPLLIPTGPLFLLYVKSSEKYIVKEHERWTVL